MNKLIKVTSKTTPNDLDTELDKIWFETKTKTFSKKKIILTIDISENKWISLSKVLTVKSVLDKHRENTKRFIDHSNILVQSKIMEKIIQTALIIIKTENPVYVIKVEKTQEHGS